MKGVYVLNSISLLSKNELLRLAQEYNEYVMNYVENSEGYPVSLEEFYDNEYQCILYVGDRVRFDITDFLDEDLHKWLMEHKAINFEVVEVDNESELFWIESNGVRCPYAISLYENYRRVNLKTDICKISMVNKEDNSVNEYFVEIDDDFEDNIKRLKEIAETYSSYQEIEDFIYCAFVFAKYSNEEIEY